MPFYEFRCTNCHEITESRAPVGRDIDECEECGGWKERIYLTAPGVLIRPGGWSLRPGDRGYDDLPMKDRDVNKAGLGSKKKRKFTDRDSSDTDI